MGVPKFFRWLSERYPAISQLIAENRIPEFDCLYLDMNGIIHNCTHKDSDSPTFRMTEDKMFIAIFNYIEHLFSKIKPQKLFFMAVDGVAPRAKMNQQRSRRFRTALDTEKAREKAIKEGVEMPKEEAFDSNAITPGTPFMARLTRQLKYFISKKVSEDVDWQGVEVILSGHEVPGEGEHKIMEYIRHAKAQNDYDPNMRHCLYGLDADLIMLGLLSHDPHFCLLREEVTFGRQAQKKSKELEHQNFYLMHLCIVREYLELEFQELKLPGVLDFPFDMERVIDDFILMAFFVGNDFLPNLPNLHINEGALALMFKIYKELLPNAGGYINDRGVIKLERLALLLEELSRVEYRFFESDVQDARWFKGKQMEKTDVMERGSGKKKKGNPASLSFTTAQKELLNTVKQYIGRNQAQDRSTSLDLPASLPARDRKFVQDLADDLHLEWRTVEDEESERHLRLNFPGKLPGDEEDDSEYDEEAEKAISRVIQRYDKAKIEDVSAEEVKEQADQQYERKFQEWKDKYYQTKFDWDTSNAEELRKLAENYVQGLQWTLFYYYRGIASWPWFYGYHYAPMISDVVKGVSADLNFPLGQPFKPFEQLMGVLPDRSKKIVPEAFHELMTSPESPIIDFYPRDFELDMNGKKMEWEAVVKIPFIDEGRLLKAMATKEPLLAEEERARNGFGVSLKFTYSQDLDYVYPSSLIGIFPDLAHCHCVENIFDLPVMEGLEVFVGLMEGARLGVSALAGFPSLQTIPYHGELDFHGVNVFQQDSRNESMVVTILDPEARSNLDYAKKQLGQRAFVNWPYLQESKVVRVSDELFDYVLASQSGTPPIAVPHGPAEIEQWKRKANQIERNYSKRLGIVIGEIEALIHVEPLKGLRKTDDGATIKEYGHIPGIETDFASQMIVDEVVSEDQRFIEKAALPIQEEFPVGTRAFCLGDYGYGRPLEVTNHISNKAEVWISVPKLKDSDFASPIIREAEKIAPYVPSFAVAQRLGLNPLVLSKITASFNVDLYGTRVNLGLNLKFEAKKLKVLGYSRRSSNGWEFSQKAIQLIQQYMIQFPQFIATIQSKPKGDIYQATDFYPEDQALAKIKEIQAWLKSIESKSFEKVPLEAEQLDSEIVLRIEQAADNALSQNTEVSFKKLKGVPRNALLLPADAEHRLGNQTFALGHRVVYVQDSGKVPIASRGTVVGLTRTARTTLLDVVFDGTFMSGTSLNDRCSAFRGQTIPVSSVLNITHRQLLVGSEAANARRTPQHFQPLTAQAYGMPVGAGGRGQLMPASAPPPLRGSFRGVVAGPGMNGGTRSRGGGHPTVSTANGGRQQDLPIHPKATNGTRGRGSATNTGRGGRGGIGSYPGNSRAADAPPNGTSPAPANGWTTVKKSYNNVPPPSNIDTAARGGGRGRGRARGGNGRGRGTSRGRGAVDVQPQ